MNSICKYYIDKFNLKNYLNKEMLACIILIEFNKGEYICKVNDELSYFYILVEGKTKVTTLLSNGKSLLLAFYKPLSVIGDIEFLYNPLADCNVITLDKCKLLAIPLPLIKEYGINDCVFLRFIIGLLEKKLRSNSSYSSINLYYPLENRFASYILSIASLEDLKNNTIPLENLTHISELLGTSYRHLTRTIKSLTEKNIILKKKNIIYILNMQKLKSIAGDLYI